MRRTAMMPSIARAMSQEVAGSGLKPPWSESRLDGPDVARGAKKEVAFTCITCAVPAISLTTGSMVNPCDWPMASGVARAARATSAVATDFFIAGVLLASKA